MDAEMNTHSLANLQGLIATLAALIIGNTKLAKVGIKSCRFAKKCTYVQLVHP